MDVPYLHLSTKCLASTPTWSSWPRTVVGLWGACGRVVLHTTYYTSCPYQSVLFVGQKTPSQLTQYLSCACCYRLMAQNSPKRRYGQSWNSDYFSPPGICCCTPYRWYQITLL